MFVCSERPTEDRARRLRKIRKAGRKLLRTTKGYVRDKMLRCPADSTEYPAQTVSNAAMAGENKPAYDFYVKCQKREAVCNSRQQGTQTSNHWSKAYSCLLLFGLAHHFTHH